MVLFSLLWLIVIGLSAIAAIIVESLEEPQDGLQTQEPFGSMTSDGLSSLLAVL